MNHKFNLLILAAIPSIIKAEYDTYSEQECIFPETDQPVVEKDGTLYCTTTVTRTASSTRTVFGKSPRTRIRVRTLTKTSKSCYTVPVCPTTTGSTNPSSSSHWYPTSSATCWPSGTATGGPVGPTSGTSTGTGTGTVVPTSTTGTIGPTSTGCPCVTQTVTKTADVKCRTVVIMNPVRTVCQVPSTTVTISLQ